MPKLMLRNCKSSMLARHEALAGLGELASSVSVPKYLQLGAPQAASISTKVFEEASSPSPAKASCLSSMYGAAQHQLGHVRVRYNVPKPMFAGLLFSRVGHC